MMKYLVSIAVELTLGLCEGPNPRSERVSPMRGG